MTVYFPLFLLTGVKRKRCGTCDGCIRCDCGICKFCKDKPKFGGMGKKKQCCELRRCEKLITMTDKTSDKMQISVDQYLQRSGRKIQHIRGDGNCMFRAFSFAFLHHEDHHFHLRSHIVRTMNLNEELFSEYLMPINKATISEQVKHMMRPGVWGTHLELKAAATLFQIPIYCCTQNSQQHDTQYSWSVINPFQACKSPYIIDEVAQDKAEISHIEVYHHSSHYDAIVSTDSGKMCFEPPKSPEKMIQRSLVLNDSHHPLLSVSSHSYNFNGIVTSPAIKKKKV